MKYITIIKLECDNFCASKIFPKEMEREAKKYFNSLVSKGAYDTEEYEYKNILVKESYSDEGILVYWLEQELQTKDI